MGLLIKNLHGQGYGKGSNIKGKENGVQKRIVDINPCAIFVLSDVQTYKYFVVSDAARCCVEANGFFIFVQHIYSYFSASTKHWQILISHISDLGIIVQPLSETRCKSLIDSLKPLKYHLGIIYDTLTEIFNDTSLAGSSRNTLQIAAKALAGAISKFKFVVSLVTCCNILFEVNRTSRLLQNKEDDFNKATR